MSENSLPEWCHVGAPVVLFTPAQWREGGSITPTTVVRIGKRDVVLENGERINGERMSRQNGTWAPNTLLLAPDDPEVTAARAANKRLRALSTASGAWEKFARSKSAEDGAAVVTAINAWLALPPPPDSAALADVAPRKDKQ